MRYLARYTHRVAISNRRLIACDEKGVTFKWKDYRLEGPERYQVMTLATHEFIRRFLMHVLPAGFHRIRYYGLLASGNRAENIARARELLMPPIIPVDAIKAIGPNAAEPEPQTTNLCPCCGGRMIIIERFERRRNSALPSEPAAASDQDRHLMIPSLPINDRYQTYSCWLAARHSQARIYLRNSRTPARKSARSTCIPVSARPPDPNFRSNRPHHSSRPGMIRPNRAPKSP